MPGGAKKKKYLKSKDNVDKPKESEDEDGAKQTYDLPLSVADQIRRSERNNKGIPPNRYGFPEDSVCNLTPFVSSNLSLPTSTPMPSSHNNSTNPFLDTSIEETVVPQFEKKDDDAVEQLRKALQEFQFDMMKAISERNIAMSTEISEWKKSIDVQFHDMVHVLRQQDEDIRVLKKENSNLSQSVLKAANKENQNLSHAHNTNVKQGYCNPPAMQDNFVSQPVQHDFTSTMNLGKKKLIDLPPFYGKPEDWPLFITSFNETTLAYSYTNLDNSIRLRKSLSGSALEAVQAMLIHPENVPNVIKELQFRFGRPELLVKSQFEIIKKIPRIRDDDMTELINFSTKMQNLVSFLHNANADQYLQNPALLDELLMKLPLQRRLEWAENLMKMNTLPSLADFAAWISRLARVASLIETTSIATATSSSKPQPFKRSMIANEMKFEVKCYFCQENHRITQCLEFSQLSIPQRWDWVKKSAVCFSCLRYGHRINNCKNVKQCNIDSCKLKHHYLLHEKRDVPTTTSVFCCEPSSYAAPVLSMLQSNEEIYFRVVPVKLFNAQKVVETFALLDEGSSTTIIDQSLVNELNLNGKPTRMTMQWLNDEVDTQDTIVINCEIQGLTEGCQKITLRNVHAWKNLSLPCQTMRVNDLLSSYPQLNGIPIRGYKDAKPRLLIGLDNARLGFAKGWIDCPPNGPIVVDTALGWIVYGPFTSNQSVINRSHILFVKSSLQQDLKNSYEELSLTVKNFYELEHFGVKESVKPLQPIETIRALEILENTTTHRDDYYETGLLWKSENVQMPDSYSMALSRLQNLEKKMNRDEEYGKMYRNEISNFLLKGYARKLSVEEASVNTNKTWYLPHFGVININKPGKVRPVFDAAAAVGEVSLNTHLLKGPDLNQPLMSLLSKFREKPIAVCADIKEMFLQIKIRPEDRQAQRFLWRDSNSSKPVEIYEMSSMLFGATSSPTTAQYIKNCHAEKFRDEYPDAVNAIVYNFYVDDYVISFENKEEAILVSRQVKEILKTANFDLCKFVSNCNNIMTTLNGKDEGQPSAVNFNVESKAHVDKILGMYWKNQTDEFVFDFKFNKIPKEVLSQTRPPTKREVLSIVMSLFDPFGFLTNFHIYAKILLQSLWSNTIEWDDLLSEPYATKWFSWQSELMKVKEFKIPRCYATDNVSPSTVELHVFVDASIDAYAAVSYWRFVNKDSVTVSFIYGKARVAPNKTLSILRIELQSAVLGVRMKEAVLSNHKIQPSKIYFWSDSKTVIKWVNSESRNYKPFVAHRISEILESSSPNDWYWLPTHLNVADEATRAKLPIQLDGNSRWIKGPSFIHELKVEMPFELNELNEFEIQEELRPAARMLLVRKSMVNSVPVIGRFSKYIRLRRATAWFNRAVKLFLKNAGEQGELTSSELDAAEQQLCRAVQQEAFGNEYECLKFNNPLQSNSVLYNLNPYLDDNGLIRLQGRIDAATVVPLSTRRPIILPKKHQLTHLIIAYYHEMMLHANHETVICKIREKFWIPHLRQQLNVVRHRCQHCKVEQAKPKQPIMGPLPFDRLAAYVRPFTFTGLDYFGPINVAIGRRREKRWVALFTCLTTRALHLELATDLSTDACILCLRNFVNIRGVPKRIRSDNGTNFVGMKKELMNVPDFFDTDTIQREMSNFGIEWVFNTPHDPSAGGVWERLVQSVKRSLYATLKDRVPREDTLRSLLVEAANIVNSRPFTHIPVSSEDEEPITPNHFLLGDVNSNQVPGQFNEKMMCLRKQWRICQQLKNYFYKRWIAEYLPILTRRSKWFQHTEQLKIGDLVIVCEVELPRSKWPKGRIVNIYKGKDGQVRAADVKTVSTTLKRPSNKIAVLDVVANLEDSRGEECRTVTVQ